MGKGFIVLLMQVFVGVIFADPRIPDTPFQPRVDINETRHALGDHTYRVSLINARGDKRSGLLALKTDFIDIDVSDHGSVEKRKVSIASIDSIELKNGRGPREGGMNSCFIRRRLKSPLQIKKSLSAGPISKF